MRAVLLGFWRCCMPGHNLTVGLLGLLVIPLLPSMSDSRPEVSDNLLYMVGFGFLVSILPAGIVYWMTCWEFGLTLPLKRRRLFDLRIAAECMSSLPAILLVLIGYWLRPAFELGIFPLLLSGAMIMLLAAVSCTALTPLFDTWHTVLACIAAAVVIFLHIGLFAILIFEPSLDWLPGCIAALLLPLAYLGGRNWFERWEPGVGGRIAAEKLPGNGSRTLTRPFAIASVIGSRIGRRIDRWHPARRFVVRGLYLSWSFLFIVFGVSVSTAMFVGMSLWGSVFMAGIWVFLGMINAGTLCGLIKQRLALFMSFRRERLFDAVNLPMVAVYMIVALAFIIGRHVEINGKLRWQDSDWRWALNEPGVRNPRKVTNESAKFLSENFCRDFAARFGFYPDARVVEKRLLDTGRIETSAYDSEAQGALWRQASVFFSVTLFMLFLGSAMALPRTPRRSFENKSRFKLFFQKLFAAVIWGLMIVSLYPAIVRKEALLDAKEIVQLGNQLLDWSLEARVRLLAAEYAPVLLPLLLLACVVLYIRNRRAFRMQESVANPQIAWLAK